MVSRPGSRSYPCPRPARLFRELRITRSVTDMSSSRIYSKFARHERLGIKINT